METEWLKDFIMLASTQNFSKAASLRNLSQPSFSRRIQQLEMWLGVQLVDRSVYPATLTNEGRDFRRAAEEIIQLLDRERDLARGVAKPKRAFISFSMVQTIATSFFPAWLVNLEESLGPLRTTVMGGSIYDCFQALASQSCDIMISYESRFSSFCPDEKRYSSIKIADEYLVPVSAPGPDGAARYTLDAKDARPIPYLGFSNYAHLARLVEGILQSQPEPPKLDLCYESPLAAALKAMAMAGRGIAWLPYFNVVDDIEVGRLVIAGGPCWASPMEIRAYRASGITGRSQVEALWSHLGIARPLQSRPPFAPAELPVGAQPKSTLLVRLSNPLHASKLVR